MKQTAYWVAGYGPHSPVSSSWGAHPFAWWRKKVSTWRSELKPDLYLQVLIWGADGKQQDPVEFKADELREAKAFAKKWVEDGGSMSEIRGMFREFGAARPEYVDELGGYDNEDPTMRRNGSMKQIDSKTYEVDSGLDLVMDNCGHPYYVIVSTREGDPELLDREGRGCEPAAHRSAVGGAGRGLPQCG